MLKLCARSPTHSCPLARCWTLTQVALVESQLAAWLLSIQERLQAIPLTYSTTRTWGSFTPTNLSEVLAALAALACELEAVAASAHVGGVLRDYERVEQLLAGVTRSMEVW